jgi:hypothetical protein
MTPAGSNLGEHYQILKIQSSAPDDGQKHRPKHVEPTWNNKLIYIVHLVGYFCSWASCSFSSLIIIRVIKNKGREMDEILVIQNSGRKNEERNSTSVTVRE